MGRLQTISTTVVLTSLAWLGFGFWLWAGRSPAPDIGAQAGSLFTVHSDAPARTPARGPAPSASSVRLLIPVAGVRPNQLIDTFAQGRAAGARRHDAIDILAPLGTPVLAAAAGRIEKIFLSNEGGKTIYVRSPDRTTIHYYAHLDGYAAGLAEGQPVSAGQRIGSVGFTGNANPAAPHLHFAVLRIASEAPWHAQATAINPYPLLTAK